MISEEKCCLLVKHDGLTNIEQADAEVLSKFIAILRQNNHQLEQKNEELQAFAYALVHDLITPLSVISSFAELLSFDKQDDSASQDQQYVENILKATTQMKQFISNLLEYIRVGHKAVMHQPVVIYGLLVQIVRELQPRLDETQAEISIPLDLPVIDGDPTFLSQIFINLFNNALTYSRQGTPPKIRVRSSVETHHADIGVADNGIGIASQDYERIFTILQRLHKNEQYPGTGIGLAFVKKAVEMMDGRVWVESIVGEGSTFWVRLPLP